MQAAGAHSFAGGGLVVALAWAAGTAADMGPVFGRSWSASVASNMTQIGFDMGMVLVNFSGTCDTPANLLFIHH